MDTYAVMGGNKYHKINGVDKYVKGSSKAAYIVTELTENTCEWIR